MKKSFSALLIALIICCTSFLTGCGILQTNTSSVLTLTEAKQLVLNGLDVSNTQTTLTKISSSNIVLADNSISDNRNVFIKLINAEFSVASENNFGYGSNIISGYVQRINDAWSKYVLNTGSYYGYYDGEYEYSKNNTNYAKNEFSNTYFGLVLQSMDCIYIDLLFLDSAWSSIYNSTAEKVSNDSGYTLTMDINMASYVDYVMAECESKGLPTEGLFSDGEARQMNKDDGSVSLTISFDAYLNVIGLSFSVKSYAFNGSIENATLETTTININKCNETINAPEWFDEENYI